MVARWLFGVGLLTVLGAGPATEGSKPDLAEYEAVKASVGRDASAQVKLALWCEAHGLSAERSKHLALAVLTDPRLSLRAWEFVVAYRWDFFALGFYASGAAGLLVATLLSFDRCLGRAPASSRSEPAPHVFPDVVQFSSPEPRKSGPGNQSLTTDGRLR